MIDFQRTIEQLWHGYTTTIAVFTGYAGIIGRVYI